MGGKLSPETLGGVVMKAMAMFDILLDGGRPAGWDGIILYRVRTDAYVPWHYY